MAAELNRFLAIFSRRSAAGKSMLSLLLHRM